MMNQIMDVATQHQAELRSHLVLGMLRRVTELAESGVHLGDDRMLEGALQRIARMRRLLEELDARKPVRWSEEAVGAGYFDHR